MTAASAGIAFGTNSDVTSEAASAVVLDSSLERLDELLHISERMRRIALQSAIGGIVASSIGMGFAMAGALSPVAGALLQEVIDILAILNAARVAMVSGPMVDYSGTVGPTGGCSGGAGGLRRTTRFQCALAPLWSCNTDVGNRSDYLQ